MAARDFDRQVTGKHFQRQAGVPGMIDIATAEIGISGQAPGDLWLQDVASWTLRVKLSGTMFMDLLTDMRRRAHATAIDVFARMCSALNGRTGSK